MATKIKNRGWVKNVAIIFLTVMLLLTFFSNTIMNRSLPEVATQNVMSDSITAKIRGTGTVAANQSYEVMADSTRKVQSVLIKEGQEVNVGDVLFVMEAGSSEELSAAKEALRQLQMNYQKALLNAADSDYAKENREIQLAREALETAEKKQDELYVSDAQLAQAKENVKYCKDIVESEQKKYEQAQKELEEFGKLNKVGENDIYTYQTNIKAKQQEISMKEQSVASDYQVYGARYYFVEKEARERALQFSWSVEETMPYVLDMMSSGEITNEDFNNWVAALKVQLDAGTAQYDRLERKVGINNDEYYVEHKTDDNVYVLPIGDKSYEAEDFSAAYEALKADNEALDKLYEELSKLQTEYQRLVSGDNSSAYNAYNEAVKAAKERVDDATEAQTEAETRLKELQDQQTAYETALETVKQQQSALENLIFALNEQQKTDDKNQQLEAIDLQDLAYQISEKQKEVDKYSGEDDSANEIKANVSGIVRAVSVTAGGTTTSGSSMATIEIPDMGYSLSFSVTNDQARQVHTGDVATVSNYYWGTTIEATLTGIKTDPKNPQTSKLLVFELSGDVTPGSSLTLSVGQKSAQYDYVVPNSAIRSDANGSFVLIVTAKSSPLGNRYTATRVDVTVLASDDTSSAISGGLEAGDFVITTSTAPIKSGDKVRMADAA